MLNVTQPDDGRLFQFRKTFTPLVLDICRADEPRFDSARQPTATRSFGSLLRDAIQMLAGIEQRQTILLVLDDKTKFLLEKTYGRCCCCVADNKKKTITTQVDELLCVKRTWRRLVSSIDFSLFPHTIHTRRICQLWRIEIDRTQLPFAQQSTHTKCLKIVLKYIDYGTASTKCQLLLVKEEEISQPLVNDPLPATPLSLS